MKNAFRIIITFLLLCSFTGLAQVTIYSHKNVADPCWIDPCIQIVNSSPDQINLKNYTIDYYFYNTRYPLSYYKNAWSPKLWYYSGGNTAYISIHTYDPPYELGDKKANFRVRISFSGDEILNAGENEELEVAVVSRTWNNQDQTNDWSYISGQNWLENENIVVKDLNGNIVFGNEPGNTVQKPNPVSVNWLGLIDNLTFQDIQDAGLFDDGDAYKNSDDNKSYVRYKGDWQVLSATGDEGYRNGWTMNTNNCNINMNQSSIINVKEVDAYEFSSSVIIANSEIGVENPPPEYEPSDPEKNATGARKGSFLYYPEDPLNENDCDWYLYIRVNDAGWRRVKLTKW